MDIICKIPIYNKINDDYLNGRTITIRNIYDEYEHGYIYIDIDDRTTILMNGKELIDGIQRCMT